MSDPENVAAIVEEYRAIFENENGDHSGSLERRLHESGEWTATASLHLISLAENYGSFMLQNALAISLALDIEDGEFGF
jgi:hypothetical protein